MLRAALGFFIVGLLAMILGANNVAGLSIDIGRTLLTIFVILAVISVIVGLFTGRKTGVLALAGLLAGSLGGFASETRADTNATERVQSAIRDGQPDVNRARQTDRMIAANRQSKCDASLTKAECKKEHRRLAKEHQAHIQETEK